jgi:hypothetical protein
MRRHRSAIREGDDGPFVWGSFERLLTDCLVNRALGREDVDQVHRELRAVANRLTDLRTIAMKLDWLLEQRDSGTLDPMVWMLFATSDVSGFLTNVRSLFDHLARSMRAAAPQPRSIPQFSFNDLRKWALREDLEQGRQIGERVHELVVACSWFEELRDLRDELVHRDATALVFPTESGIAVQVYGGVRLLIDEPALMQSESVASFERLAAATMARLYSLLEDAADAMSDQLKLREQEGDGQSVHGGLRVLSRWTDDYLLVLGDAPDS